MHLSKPYIPGLILYILKSGQKAAESAGCINRAFDEDTVSECTTQDWFIRSCTGDHDVEDQTRLCCPSGPQ